MPIGLTLLNGSDKGRSYTFENTNQLLIGRDPACDIFIDEKMVSKNHARILCNGDELAIEDMLSRNGTFLNSSRISTSKSLVSGDTITIGMSVFKVMQIENSDNMSSAMHSIYSEKHVLDAAPPLPSHSYSERNSPKLIECTQKMQEILRKHTDGIVKESLKVIFHILPITRLAIFNINNDQLTQGYTILRKAGKTASKMSISFALKVLERNEAVLIQDTSDFEQSENMESSFGFQQVRSIIGVPIEILGKTSAILLGDNLEQPNILNDEHLRIMRFASKAIEVLHQRDAIYKLDNMGNFLPICACCKKIRDDKGYWNQLEAFISKKADVTFSHGYCPECADKLMRELDEK